MQLSVCIITKNEEKNIKRCLESLQGYDVEIVVVDTGSTDRTREVAEQYTEAVYDFVWCDDFATAKNFAISKASNEMVLVLDSDEYIESIDLTKVKQFLKIYPKKVGRIQRRNFLTRKGQRQENTEWINRVFSKERFCYQGRIHEQVTEIDGAMYETYQLPIVIGHTGYDLPEEERRKKAERNIVLLEQELVSLLAEHNVQSVEEDIELQMQNLCNDMAAEQIPYIIYQLGKGYYMAEDYEVACDYFSKGLSYDLNPKLEYVIDMVETYGYAMINSGQAENALFFENIYEEFGKSADFQFLMGLIYMNNARFEDAVCEFLKATKQKECKNKGVNSHLAFYNIGVIYECLGNLELAKEYYAKCGVYEPAKVRIEEIRRQSVR